MQRLPIDLKGPILIAPVVHRDDRGFFQETYRRSVLADFGVDDEFVQQNHSRSRRGVVRGMHFQPGMAKLVRCAHGAVLDVAVDIRPASPGFGRWGAWRLDDEACHQLYIPAGFAHGFCVLSDDADVLYSCSSYYDAATERGFRYDDPDVGIEWPDIELRPSAKDASAPRFSEIAAELRAGVGGRASGG